MRYHPCRLCEGSHNVENDEFPKKFEPFSLSALCLKKIMKVTEDFFSTSPTTSAMLESLSFETCNEFLQDTVNQILIEFLKPVRRLIGTSHLWNDYQHLLRRSYEYADYGDCESFNSLEASVNVVIFWLCYGMIPTREHNLLL